MREREREQHIIGRKYKIYIVAFFSFNFYLAFKKKNLLQLEIKINHEILKRILVH